MTPVATAVRTLDPLERAYLHRILRAASVFSGSELVSLSLASADGQVVSLSSDGHELVERSCEDCPVWSLVQNGPVIIPDLTRSSQKCFEKLLQNGIASLVAYPLLTSCDELLGMLCIKGRTPREFSDQDLAQLGEIIGLITHFLETCTSTARDAERQALMDNVLETAPNGILAMRAVRAADGAVVDFTCTLTNSAARGLIKRRPSQMHGHPIGKALPGGLAQALFERCVKVLNTQKATAFDTSVETPDLHIWLRVGAVRLDDDSVTVSLDDITEYRSVQAQLQRQALVLDTLNDAVTVLDLDGTIIEWTGGSSRLFGFAKSDVIGQHIAMVYLPEEAERALAGLTSVAEGNDWRGESTIVCKDGSQRVVETVAVPMHNEKGATIAIIAVSRDVTYRSSAERELRAHALKQHALNLELEAQKQALEDQHAKLELINQELAEAWNAAKAANETKSAFLANMSHEIRTPMTAILGYADLLADGGLETEQEQHLATIRRNGQHLLTIINDILDLSKIEAGKMTVERTTVAPLQLVTDVVALMEPRAQGKGVALETAFEFPLPATIQSDLVRLRQVLVNLVGNAVKFTEAGTVRVAVSLQKRQDGEDLLQVDVVDTGIGMSPAQLTQLFNPFAQADVSHARRFGGTGLGLTISKRLIEMLGGELWVESTQGVGSQFSISVQVGDLRNTELLDEFREVETTAPDGPPISELSLSGHVLLAEDGPDNQRLISAVLKKAGLQVDVAENGRVALEKVRAAEAAQTPFDLVLMDMQMPEMDGYAATAALRQGGFELPIIALTAHAMGGDREKCLAAGCTDYATKPINRTALLVCCRRWIQRDEKFRDGVPT